MKRHAAAGNFLLPLLLLELVSLGRGNRLPYFINYFFDTYLLINEDTPVARDRFLVNAEIDPVILGLFPGSQSIKLVLFNQGL
ncbi:cadherin-23 [Grus japonensis]|uniref:Cadherin-23 n=1 Tax=Grus japonensis TaxID=30415 RepID=A0ABC9X4C7_GRUJA